VTDPVSPASPEVADAVTEGDTVTRFVQALGVGVAVVDPETWSVLFENPKFFQWFPSEGDGDGTLDTRLPGFNADRARERLSGNRPYRIECEVKSQTRTISLMVDFKALSDEEGAKILVECSDISKQKETQYMLDSYSAMSEKHSRQLQR
jgi:adenylate cyclase